MATQCQAISLSDQHRCDAAAGGKDGLFCLFHARQCYGLYRGYKRRNLEYDKLTRNPPPLLQGKALHEIDLALIDDEGSLKNLHDHLFRRHALLDRVIRARRIHSLRFFSLELDYGHEQYLNQLSAERQPLLRTLERVIRRTAEVLYHKQKWFQWVRKLEDDEEKERDAEKRKVKQEAALFKRHMKEVEARMRKLRAKENEKRQLEFLDKAWQERKLNMADYLDETTADDSWDPIEDAIEDERGNYIELLRHFLWQAINNDLDRSKQPLKSSTTGLEEGLKNVKVEGANENDTAPSESSSAVSRSKNAKKKARQKANARAANPTEPVEQARPGEVHVETASEMRARLRAGEKYDGQSGWARRLSADNTIERQDHSPPLKEEEIDELINEIKEIKQLLFCRLLLAHAALLPAGLRADSIEEFLADEQVSNVDLRDLCLKMEQPGLQEVRDACADLKREEADEEDQEEKGDVAPKRRQLLPRGFKSAIPKSFQTKREKAMKANREKVMPHDSGNFVDFGDIDDQGQYHIRKIRVKICGRYIYNYPSEKAMSRGGWLQFSVIAKDCKAFDAVKLCRSWEEFYELATLIRYNYFPAVGWASFLVGPIISQLQTLGFFIYGLASDADEHSLNHQTGRGHNGPRQYGVVESRNYICGQMKRNDPISRRFIQYCALQPAKMVMFVRDVATGDVLAKPPDDELWLKRMKFGFGRASRNDWDVTVEVGPEFFEQMDKGRRWTLEFKDYYDIIIWDFIPGQRFPVLCNDVQTNLFKALRFKAPEDIYKPSERILKSITMDRETDRGRDMKPGEEGSSMWDLLTGPDNRHMLMKGGSAGDGSAQPMPDEWKYNEADRLEDEVLFPWEHTTQSANDDADADADAEHDKAGGNGNNKHREDSTIMTVQQRSLYDFENHGPDLDRWVHDLDTDEELSDLDDAEFFPERQTIAEEDVSEEGSEYDDDWLDEDEQAMTDEEKDAFGEMANAYLDWQKGFITDRSGFTTDQAATNKQVKKLKQQEKKRVKQEMAQEMEVFIDRSRAVAFKDSWHRADLETNAQERWSEYTGFMSMLDKWLKRRLEGGAQMAQPQLCRLFAYSYRLMIALDVNSRVHYRVVRDMISASEYVSLFFSDSTSKAFFSSEAGKRFSDTMMLNQEERAKHPPDRRSPHSNKLRPNSQFHEWDTLKQRNRTKYIMDAFPEHWNLITRPIIACLYRENIINAAYREGSAGPAVSLTEPDRPGKPDFFVDWRHLTPSVRFPPDLEDPTKVSPLASQAKTYASQNPNAVFSALKIWSSPHFWPLMLDVDNRENVSFTDGLSRHWEWKFIPKDMPASEWSIHAQNKLRLDINRPFLDEQERRGNGKVVLKKDMFLVMARDAEQCRYLTTALVWIINTRPWRLEVDPWKSWINVDVGFLERLHEKWWE